MAHAIAIPFHHGESATQSILHVPSLDNPTLPYLSLQAAAHLPRAPLIAIGTLDAQFRPWTTLWGGTPGFAQPLGRSIIGIKTYVDAKFDPVVQTLFGVRVDGEVVREEGQGRMVSGLTIDLQTRKRVKIAGRMVAGAVARVENAGKEGREVRPEAEEHRQAQVQLVIHVEQSLGNCPKYLNSKQIQSANTSAELISDSSNLSPDAIDLIRQADLFFLSSSNASNDMDTNHRGGPVGFLRHRRNEAGIDELIWPEYSGNRLYQTLGNLYTTPRAGLVIPCFSTGNVLYLTGTTETFIGKAASAILTRSNVVVKITITATRLVRNGLPFRGDPGEPSPYNPVVRPLVSEAAAKSLQQVEGTISNTATLLEQMPITPTISRFRFSMSNQTRWKPGQWVALDFSSEMDIGYSHMRDDDPRSLNDDFIRTFTVSSPPTPRPNQPISDGEFEITIRKVGAVTDFLFKQHGRSGLEVPVRGFGGEIRIEQECKGEELTPIVVGGVGVTPLLAQLPFLDLDRLAVFWMVHADDTNLVLEVLGKWPRLSSRTSLFITGVQTGKEDEMLRKIEATGAQCETRRLRKEDLDIPGLAARWHVCVSTTLRKALLEWLEGKEVVYEDFNF